VTVINITLEVDKKPWGQDANQTVIRVNDTLTISLNITDETPDKLLPFLFPRNVLFSILWTRKILDAGLFKEKPWMDGFLKRVIPFSKTDSVKVVDSLFFGQKDNNITLNLRGANGYTITNKTFNNGETLTMRVFVSGFLPDDLNGLTDGLHTITNKVITLNVEYVDLE
jgi:hypothetical protein